MSADDQYLFAANSNFDLEYNAGTLVAIDVGERLTQAIAEAQQDTSDADFVHVPIESLIRSDQTIRFGAFASDLEITPLGDRLLIPVRGERAILLIDVAQNEAGLQLNCGQGPDRRCDSAHKVESNDQYSLPIEPYEVGALNYVEPLSGQNGEEQITTLGFATHLDGGEVSLFVVRDGSMGGRAAAELIRVVEGVVPGASGIAVNPQSNDIYVSGRHAASPYVAVMRVLTDSENGSFSRNPYFGSVKKINIKDDLTAATDIRGIAVTSTGDRAYAVVRKPEALIKFDLESNKFLDMVSVGATPTTVTLIEDNRGTPQDPSDDQVYAFVLCFTTDQVFIIDTQLMEVIAVREAGSGPQAMAFDRARQRVYIANFRESTISILSTQWPFDYFKAPDGRMIKIGEPRLPKGHD